MAWKTVSEDEPFEGVIEERTSFRPWRQEQGDPLSDENIQAAIDGLSDEERDRLVRLAAERLARDGFPIVAGDERWIGACYDIMRALVENDMTLDEVEGG